MSEKTAKAEPSSFRDPSGTVFRQDGRLYRQVNLSFAREFDYFHESGLYDALAKRKVVVQHKPADVAPYDSESAHSVIRPEEIGFISYPFEWCFSQLRDAALLTLEAHRLALDHGMVLKDASAFNIQFKDGRPILIDSLSFGLWDEGEPWEAYRQFCQHFLAPLALISYRSADLGQFSRLRLDGIPLRLASELLPWRSRLSPGLLVHLHLHAGAQQRFKGQDVKTRARGRRMSRQAMQGLAESLTGVIRSLKWESSGTDWAGYAEFHNYSDQALDRKRALVREYLERADPETVWDLGANTGEFSRIASDLGARTVSFDSDPGAVETNYLRVRREDRSNLLPLVMDLTNPTPGLGWALEERHSLLSRGPADVVLALALIHHLAIGNNVPFERLAEFLARLSRWAVIEFVPKHDPQVQKLLSVRRDIFWDYDQTHFREVFQIHFEIQAEDPIGDSDRTLFLLRSRAL